MAKRGDTLIEVTLAIGIFSMVAISVVAVMTSGTSNAQNALETTLAREEIDTQAEALRFIHSAYLADENSEEENGKYANLWNEIVNNAFDPSQTDDKYNQNFLQYNPSTCQSVYENEEVLNKAFVINPRVLGTDDADKTAYISYIINSAKFRPASTSPRLIYSADVSAEDLLESDSRKNNNINLIEGIYVLAVTDPNTTNVVGTGKSSAYYDFYIRTCWYGTGSEAPSTISTVIRLYNPKNLQTD